MKNSNILWGGAPSPHPTPSARLTRTYGARLWPHFQIASATPKKTPISTNIYTPQTTFLAYAIGEQDNKVLRIVLYKPPLVQWIAMVNISIN